MALDFKKWNRRVLFYLSLDVGPRLFACLQSELGFDATTGILVTPCTASSPKRRFRPRLSRKHSVYLVYYRVPPLLYFEQLSFEQGD